MKLAENTELRDIAISVVALALIFAFDVNNPSNVFTVLPFYLLTVVVAFLFHELAHRFVARRFGCLAVYKIWPVGIIMGLLFMFLGLKFAAPGAVVIYPYMFGRWGYRMVHLTDNEMGIIASSGISVNLLFALLFKPLTGTLIWQGIDVFGSMSFVNAWLALFNLLPIPPLDGIKIISWKPVIWVGLILTAVLLIIL